MLNPFSNDAAVIPTLKHVEVKREAPKAGASRGIYRKIFKQEGLGDNYRYWMNRENEFLLEFAANRERLPHTVDFVEAKKASPSEYTEVATFDAGITVADWLRVSPKYDDGKVCHHPFQHPSEFFRLASACLIALQGIHRYGVVHCDIKLDNICLPYHPSDSSAIDKDRRIIIDYDAIKLIDFAFSVTSARPLRHSLPILPVADYQSESFKCALRLDKGQSASGPFAVDGLDWRVDLFSLGYWLATILETGWPLRIGSADDDFFKAKSWELVKNLKAFDKTFNDRPVDFQKDALPHGAIIAEIGALLAEVSDSEKYRTFTVHAIKCDKPLDQFCTTEAKSKQIQAPRPTTTPTPTPPNGQKPKEKWLRWIQNNCILPIIITSIIVSALVYFNMPSPNPPDWKQECFHLNGSTAKCQSWNAATSGDGALSLELDAMQYHPADDLNIRFLINRPLSLRIVNLGAEGKLDELYPYDDTDKVRVLQPGKIYQYPEGDGKYPLREAAGQNSIIAIATKRSIPDGIAVANPDGTLTPQVEALSPTVVRLNYFVVQP
ncbi:MAG: DUF4384 domain-containing protein [Candidatus Methylumidiphilus sp.]